MSSEEVLASGGEYTCRADQTETVFEKAEPPFQNFYCLLFQELEGLYGMFLIQSFWITDAGGKQTAQAAFISITKT